MIPKSGFRLLGCLALMPVLANAWNNGIDGWLRYDSLVTESFDDSCLPRTVYIVDGLFSDSPISTARDELYTAFQSLFGIGLSDISSEAISSSWDSTVVLGTYSSYVAEYGPPGNQTPIEADGFYLSTAPSHTLILGSNERAVLYGTFRYLSHLAQGDFSSFDIVDNPAQPIRWVNQWDNLDGTIERGYGGPSIFFSNNSVVADLSRVKQYGRLLASVGFNALVVNNVNAQADLLLPSNIQGLGRIADQLRPYGIQVGISINFDSPKSIGNLSTSDPLDQGVIAWWNTTVDSLYSSVPDLAGFVVKANSEGQPGPLTYNRTFSDGANLFARALAPHGGLCMFRAFVYTAVNWTDPKADRAKQAVEFFASEDGKFDDNVVVQIKYGPIDFQVDEPPSPLFANLPNSNMVLEIQVSQEYTGQQSHFVYLAPLWKKILDFDMRLKNQSSPIRDLVSGKTTNRKLGGIAAVVNVGTNDTWLGAHLAMANFYASGRFAWNPTQTAEDVLDDWIRLTWGCDDTVLNELHNMGMDSWATYRDYTGVLGTLSPSDVFTHYGPDPDTVDGPDGSRWFRAEKDGVGIDRSVSTGTGFSGQYPAEVAAMLEVVDTTPEDLVLFFHHLPYNHTLKSGKSVIGTIYDAHYDGSTRAYGFVDQWRSLNGKIDQERYESVLNQLEYQAGHSAVWRDAMVSWYHNKTQIPDRDRDDGWKIEAESMTPGQEQGGYVPYTVDPWFAASNSTAMVLSSNVTGTVGSLWTTLNVPDGTYDISVNYFDLLTGQATWSVYLGDEMIDQWIGDNEWSLSHVPSPYVDGHSATRRTIQGVKIINGSVLRVMGEAGGGQGDPTPLDYVLLTVCQ